MKAHPEIERIDNHFKSTLAGGYDSEKSWSAVHQLRRQGNRYIFEKAAKWCLSENPCKRARGADILCQLRAPMTKAQRSSGGFKTAAPIFVDESLDILLHLIEKEADEQVLSSVLFGLGHLDQPRVVPFLTSFISHTSENVRHAVAFALGSFSRNPLAVEALVILTSDSDPDVRDWATFAIGTQSDADSTELRDALILRLQDSSAKVQEEAIAGLAKRKDIRAVLPLFKLMRKGCYFLHLESDFETLVEEERTGDDRWGTEDFIDALYAKFPELLPAR